MQYDSLFSMQYNTVFSIQCIFFNFYLSRYATFFRTIPSDGVLAQAMAFLVKDLGKPYIIVLNDPDATSRETSSLFRRHLQVKAGIS